MRKIHPPHHKNTLFPLISIGLIANRRRSAPPQRWIPQGGACELPLRWGAAGQLRAGRSAHRVFARLPRRAPGRRPEGGMSTHTEERRSLILLLLCAVQFMVVLDVSIVNVALPTIKTALHFSDANLQWVVSAYTLTFGGFLMLGSRTADLLGRRRLFLVGLALFSAASLACGLSQGEGQLIAFRAIQGLGAAIIAPASLSLLTTTFAEGEERNRALGIWGAIAGAGGAVGVLLGGILVDKVGWQWIFFINVPVGAAVVALAPRILHESRVEGAPRRFDVA